jgi:hypothetical protein
MEITQEIRIKRGHIAMMKHPETSLYSGVMMMGTSEVVDTGCPTAYTDGINKKYGRDFMATNFLTNLCMAKLTLPKAPLPNIFPIR